MADKEQCFDDAMEDFNDATEEGGGKPIDIDFQKTWVEQPAGWVQAPDVNHWWQFWEWYKKNIQGQIRRPDITMKGPDGKTLVVDKKFTRADGSVDDWGKVPGKKNGNTQKPDYNSINKQNNPGNAEAQDLALTPESCNCKGEGQPQEAPALSPVLVPIPSIMPMGLPEFPGVPAGAPVGVPLRPAFGL